MALAGSYLDVDEFAARTIAPSDLVYGDFIDPTGEFTDEVKVERRAAWLTFVESRLIIETSRINSKLRKRYAAPFESPVPEIVLGWLAAIVTPSLYKRRGWDPSEAQAEDLKADHDKAIEEITEAANSEDGLFDLPLRQDTTDDGISKGGPLGYAEASPYDWMDRQAEEVSR